MTRESWRGVCGGFGALELALHPGEGVVDGRVDLVKVHLPHRPSESLPSYPSHVRVTSDSESATTPGPPRAGARRARIKWRICAPPLRRAQSTRRAARPGPDAGAAARAAWTPCGLICWAACGLFCWAAWAGWWWRGLLGMRAAEIHSPSPTPTAPPPQPPHRRTATPPLSPRQGRQLGGSGAKYTRM